MFNPTKIVLELVIKAYAKADPQLAFVMLLTAAVVAGKNLGMNQQAIRRKIKEVDGPANAVLKMVEKEKKDESDQG